VRILISLSLLPQCAVNTLCGEPISPAMQNLFATVPDYCAIAKSCEVCSNPSNASNSTDSCFLSRTYTADARIHANIKPAASADCAMKGLGSSPVIQCHCMYSPSCVSMQAPLSSGTNKAGLETLSMTLTDATDSVQSVLGNDGHPELAAFAKSLDVNPARMVVSFTPGGLADGSNVISFVGSGARLPRFLRS